MNRFFEMNDKFYWRGIKSGTVYDGPFDTIEEAVASWKNHLDQIDAALDRLVAMSDGEKLQ